MNKAIVALLQAEIRENGHKQTKHGPVIPRSKLTKPCAGLFAYLPAKGSFKLAATTKVASVIDAKGGWSHLLALQKVHGFTAGTNDPSIAVIVELLLRELVGLSHHQRPRQQSGVLVMQYASS